MRNLTCVGIVLTLSCLGSSVVSQAGEVSVTKDELVSILLAREEAIEEVVVKYECVTTFLPGYAEQKRLRNETRAELFRRGLSKELKLVKPRTDWREYRKSQTRTLAVRADTVRIDYTVPADPELKMPEHHVTRFFDGTLWKTFASTDRHGSPNGAITLDERTTGEYAPLSAAGLEILEAIDSRGTTLGKFLSEAHSANRLDIAEGVVPSGDITCFVATGYVRELLPDRPNLQYFKCAKAFLDPNRGFAPVMIQTGSSVSVEEKGQMHHWWYMTISNIELRDVGDGIWFPTGATTVWSTLERLVDKFKPILEWEERFLETTMARISVSELHVNEGLPDEHFTFEFPEGTRVHDATTGVTYVVRGAE